MKVAALYDIHGNVPALDAVLEELKREEPDLIVIGGDFLPGPMPRQVLERLASWKDQLLIISGNGERETVQAFDGQPMPAYLDEAGKEIFQWVAQQIKPAERDVLASLPQQVTRHLEDFGDVLFCHATPQNDYTIFLPNTPDDELAEYVSSCTQPFLVCGHTHIQFCRQVGSITILNAGSVGMPYAAEPGAYWLMLGPDGYQFRKTVYDLEAAAEQILSSGYPWAQSFVEHHLLRVPSVEQAISGLEMLAERMNR